MRKGGRSSSASAQLIALLGSDVKPLALCPSPPNLKLEGDVKEPMHGFLVLWSDLTHMKVGKTLGDGLTV